MYLELLKEYVDEKLRHAFARLERPYQEMICTAFAQESAAGWNIKRILGETDIDIEIEAEDLEKIIFSQAAQTDAAFAQSCIRLRQQGTLLHLEYLLERFALSAFESHCVRMMYAFEMVPYYADVAAFLQDGWEFFTPHLARLSFTGTLDEGQLYGALSKNSMLGMFFLADTPDGPPACMRRLRLAHRMFGFACGDVLPDPGYGQLLQRWDYEQPLKPWTGPPDERVCRFLHQALSEEAQGGFLFYIYGQAGSGRRFSILHACKKIRRSCCIISLDSCCRETARMDAQEKRRWQNGLLRELLLSDSVPVFVSEQTEKEEVRELLAQEKVLLKETSEMFPAVFLCTVPKVSVQGLSFAGSVYKKPLTLLEGRAYWETESRAYLLEQGMDIGSMSSKFQLTPGAVSAILETADRSRIQEHEDCLSMERITQECYGRMEQQMGKKAVKVPAVYTMDDLILPVRQKRQLLSACSQIKYRHKIYEEWGFQQKTAYGRGVSMVFAGPPGTGKTMAAQVIARELGMQLYKVSLSCVVSKYVGETEKNLEEIFDQAEQSRVILLFDEADVLFGKRSEGSESMDKYSNMEAAFLLQKMECYEGAAILATNLYSHFDEAFKRRIKTVVEFPVPGIAERRKIWKSMIPDEMPCGEIDFDYLARQFELTGSNIRNILLHSAFLAAEKGRAMDMEEIIPAVRNEYAKNGKSLSKNDVSEYYMYLE